MNRRKFIQKSATVGFVGSLTGKLGFRALGSPLWTSLNMGNTLTDHVVVLIRLDGGNDGLNTVIPLDQYSALNVVRPQVILPENSLLNLNGSTTTKLHPSMTGIQNLFNDGKVNIVQSVGYPNPNYSHFRSTDIWMSGSDTNEILFTGWLGRYLNYEYPNFPLDYPNMDMPDPLAVEIGYNQSFAFMGPATNMSYTIADAAYFYNLVQGIQSPAPNTPAGEQLKYIRIISNQVNKYGAAIKAAYEKVNNQLTYPDTYLANQLKVVAALIAGGMKTRVYMVNLGGFDTHDSQVDTSDHTQGEHTILLKQLSDAVAAFQSDLTHLGISQRVTSMTFSEFGRRIIANDSNGTDHGAAAPLFIIGDQVQGGITGSNPIIDPNSDVEDNLPMQYDFRSIYTTILKDWLCVPEQDLNISMLNSYATLPLVSTADCKSTSVHDTNQNAGHLLVSVSPNPMQDQCTIRYQTQGGYTAVKIFNSRGQMIHSPVSGPMAAGEYSTVYEVGQLASGTYYCHFQNNAVHQVKPFVIAH